MINANPEFDVIIVGAGPAGTSLAIRLASKGMNIALIEKDKFPRHKLCGEFISPECIEHFRELDIDSTLLTSGGDRITETVFFAEQGESVSVPSDWFEPGAGGALGLSRAKMDEILMDNAKALGVAVFENSTLADVNFRQDKLERVTVRQGSDELTFSSKIFVDATGRSRILSNLVTGQKKRPSKWVAYKSHFTDVKLDPGVCEIYFFEGGYGGLSYVENGRSNHCFLIRSEVARKYGPRAEDVFESVVLRNSRASEAFQDATREFEWLAVAIDRFGIGSIRPASNVFAIGDSAAFIDPFTGSGMLLAFQSARLFANVASNEGPEPDKIAIRYRHEYQSLVRSRLRICGLMRKVSFSPFYANLVIQTLKRARPLREIIAKATRHSHAS